MRMEGYLPAKLIDLPERCFPHCCSTNSGNFWVAVFNSHPAKGLTCAAEQAMLSFIKVTGMESYHHSTLPRWDWLLDGL
jgi:hypothetical protein